MAGITVGVDGSHSARRGLEWALLEAVAHQAPLTVLTVHAVASDGWTGNPIILPADAIDLEKTRHAAEEAVAEAATHLGEVKLPTVTVRAVNGIPAQELIKASRDADLLVVGSRGTGGFSRLLLGSVSNQVVQHAHCPVTVVPEPRE